MSKRRFPALVGFWAMLPVMTACPDDHAAEPTTDTSAPDAVADATDIFDIIDTPDTSTPDAGPDVGPDIAPPNDIAPPPDDVVVTDTEDPVPRVLAFDLPEPWPQLDRNFRIIRDIDGDGRPDAARIEHDFDTGLTAISFAFATDVGAFTPGQIIQLGGSHEKFLHFGDFDGDSRLDLMIRVRSGGTPWALHLYPGTGAGTFGEGRKLSVDGQYFADFNGDGRTDILNLFSTIDSYLYLAKADGSFDTVIVPMRGTVATSGDFNGDGIADMAVGQDVWVGLGTGGFGPRLGATCNACTGVRGVTVGRFNSDNRDDLVVMHESGISLLLAESDGRLVERSVHALTGPLAAGTGDLDGDGHGDVFVIAQPIPVTSNDGLEILYGDGTGDVAARASYQNTTRTSMAPVVVDADGDGVRDLLLDGSMVAYGRGNRRVRAPEMSHLPAPHTDVPRLHDFDGDGRVDLLAFRGSPPAVVARSFGADRRLDGGTTTCDTSLSYGAFDDYDGDGRLDMRAIAGQVLSFWFQESACNFGAAREVALAGSTEGLLVVDADGDGAADLVYKTARDLHVAPGTGPGQFGATVVSPANGYVTAMVAGDLRAEGRIDVVTVDNESRRIAVYLGDADLRLTEVQHFAWDGANETVAGLEMADLDRDGDRDVLVVVRGTSSRIDILRNDGSGTLSRELLLAGEYDIRSVADFDGDGFPELFVGLNQSRSAIYRLPADGLATLMLTLHLPRGFVSADIDGDGDLDLVYSANSGARAFLTVANNRLVD